MDGSQAGVCWLPHMQCFHPGRVSPWQHTSAVHMNLLLSAKPGIVGLHAGHQCKRLACRRNLGMGAGSWVLMH